MDRRYGKMIAIIISVVSASIAMISVGSSIYYNSKSQKQYNRSLDPALSFKLIEYQYMLYLQITNTGKSAAHDIEIKVKQLENNGSREELILDELFENKFELFSGETTQGKIAVWGENMIEHTFPKVSIDVKYIKHITKKYETFSRTVIFNPAFAEKVYVEVNMDLREVNKNMATIAKANLRTANYLDGFQVAPFDDLNIIAHESLHDDIIDIHKGNTQSNIKTREETIESCHPKNNRQKRRKR